MQPREIHIAIVGTGFIGPAHVEGLRRLPGTAVVGLVEQSPHMAVEKAAQLGIPRAYGSFEEMLADPQVELVVLATPNFMHFPQAKAALEAGKHVICEKPLALTSNQSRELVALAEKTKLVNAINFNLRFYPLVHQARAMVQNGDLGDLFILQGSYLQDWLLYPTDWNWRLEPELSGDSRAVADIGSHWLDMLTFITGKKVESVYADFQTFHPIRKKPKKPLETYAGKLLAAEDYEDKPIKTEDYAAIILYYEGGTRGLLSVGQVCAGRKNRLYFEIDGSRASLCFDSERPNELWVGRRDGPNQVILKDPSLLAPEARLITAYPGGHNEGFPDTFKQLGSKVISAIRRGSDRQRPDFPTFADGHYELVLNEAIVRSARQGQRVKLEN
jgi:predicted dehydrogenase